MSYGMLFMMFSANPHMGKRPIFCIRICMSLSPYLHAESTRVEFKENLESPKPVSWLKTVSAFANSKSGTIVVGIRDGDKEKIGVSNISAAIERARTLINSRIEPSPPYEIETIEEGGKMFFMIHVEKGDFPPYYYSHEERKAAYVRKGDESVKAPSHLLNELILQGQHKRYDELESPYKIQDVSFSRLIATYKYETGKDFVPERDLKSFGLITPAERVTYAGLLLADQPYLLQSRIICTRWKGVSKGLVNTHTIDDKEFSGNIIHLLSEAENFVRQNSRNQWKVVGMRREERSDYPMEAVREALVNAIIHRDYYINGSEIHVDMYDDRLEIVSPGGMRDGRQIQNLDVSHVSSNRRNPVIADIFSRLGYAERRGSGLSRIRDSFEDALDVRFSSDDAVFVVCMRNLNYDTALSDVDEALSQRDTALSDVDEALSQGDTALLMNERVYERFSAAYPNLSRKTYAGVLELFSRFGYTMSFGRDDVSKVFGVQRRRVGVILQYMVSAGVVVRDKRDTYRFVE